MKVISQHCPNCGGQIKITNNQNSCICPFCDSALYIDDGNFHIVDDAKIMEISFEQQKYQDEQQKKLERKDRREAWKKKCKYWVLIELAIFGSAFIVILIMTLLSIINQELVKYAFTVILPFMIAFAIGLLVGPVYLTITRPDAAYEPDEPPMIKNKILFCIAIYFAEYIAYALANGVLTILSNAFN